DVAFSCGTVSGFYLGTCARTRAHARTRTHRYAVLPLRPLRARGLLALHLATQSNIQLDCCGLLYVRYAPHGEQILHRSEMTRKGASTALRCSLARYAQRG